VPRLYNEYRKKIEKAINEDAARKLISREGDSLWNSAVESHVSDMESQAINPSADLGYKTVQNPAKNGESLFEPTEQSTARF
jgi:hypothetical protein